MILTSIICLTRIHRPPPTFTCRVGNSGESGPALAFVGSRKINTFCGWVAVVTSGTFVDICMENIHSILYDMDYYILYQDLDHIYYRV